MLCRKGSSRFGDGNVIKLGVGARTVGFIFEIALFHLLTMCNGGLNLVKENLINSTSNALHCIGIGNVDIDCICS